MKLTNDITTRLFNFFDSYKRRVDFLKDLSHNCKGADEVILLVCCYLDQLAGCLFPKAGSSKGNFERLLLTHSGESDEFSSISVGDLASDFLWMAESASYTIPKPGRIQLHSDDLKPLIKFIDQTGIALIEESVRELFSSMYNSLKRNFRVHRLQRIDRIHPSERENSYGSEETVIESIISYPILQQMDAEIKEDNVKSLIKEYRYTSILYREYRCKAVHEVAGIYLDSNKFWKMKRPYFVEVNSYFLTDSVFKLEFPAFFLVGSLETCINGAQKAIVGKGLLPPAIWNAICDFNETEFLDVERVKEIKPIKLRIE